MQVFGHKAGVLIIQLLISMVSIFPCLSPTIFASVNSLHSHVTEPLTMHGVPGSSMSAISHVKELDHHQKEKVRCF